MIWFGSKLFAMKIASRAEWASGTPLGFILSILFFTTVDFVLDLRFFHRDFSWL